MRALHVFPLFSADRSNGASHYQYALTQGLRARGVQVEVLTTTTERLIGHSPFGLEWPAQLPAGRETLDGIAVRRFPVTFSPSIRVSLAASLAILRRWEREAAGVDPSVRMGPDESIGRMFRRANTRPRRYDWLAALGRGPTSLGSVRTIIQERSRYDVLLTGMRPSRSPVR